MGLPAVADSASPPLNARIVLLEANRDTRASVIAFLQRCEYSVRGVATERELCELLKGDWSDGKSHETIVLGPSAESMWSVDLISVLPDEAPSHSDPAPVVALTHLTAAEARSTARQAVAQLLADVRCIGGAALASDCWIISRR